MRCLSARGDCIRRAKPGLNLPAELFIPLHRHTQDWSTVPAANPDPDQSTESGRKLCVSGQIESSLSLK